MTDQGWVKAGELHDGSKVLSSRKEYEVVESIEYKGYNEIEVYNLIVENYHTFFITELGLKVHNIDCKNATLGQIFKQVGDNISDTKIKGDFEDVIKKLDDIAERNNIEEYIKNFDSRFRGLDPNNLDEIKKIISDASKDIDNHSSSLFKGTEGVSKAEINTAEGIKTIINRKGYSVDDFAKLLHPDRMLTDSEKVLVDSIRKEIGLPSADTLMCKVIPQSDIYKYLYNEYDGVRGFTAVSEHGANLKTLLDKYNGSRLDYNNTAFKTTTGVDGISQSVGLPDKFYGTIEYKVNDVDKISILDWKAKADDYPYTGKAFIGSADVVLPEYFQDTRKFVD